MQSCTQFSREHLMSVVPDYGTISTDAKALAATQGHKYVTVEHILAVSTAEPSLIDDIKEYLLRTVPSADVIDAIQPTNGYIRVMERLRGGMRIVDAIKQEGENCRAVYYLIMHGFLA